MKKLVLTLAALLTLCLAFTSCSSEPTKVLDADDVTADWVEKYTWSGTTKTTTKFTFETDSDSLKTMIKNMCVDSVNETTFEEQKLTADYLKTFIKLDGTTDSDEESPLKYQTCVKTNWNKTALYTEQVATLTIDLMGVAVTSKVTTVTNYTADK